MTNSLAELQEQTFGRATATTQGSYPPERRLTPEQLERYLERREYAVVGTSRPDGRPHASMSTFYVRGTSIWLPTLGKAVRVRNLRSCSWMTLVIPEDVRALNTKDWIDCWIELRTERVLSYAAEDAAV